MSLIMYGLWYFNFASFQTLSIVTGLYFAQIVFYRPQYKDGVPVSIYKHFLYTPALDPCLSYFDSILIREGPELDPN